MGEFLVHQIRFFDYTPTAIHCIAYDELNKKLAVSRSDGAIEIWSINDDWYQERLFPGSAAASVEAIVWLEGRLFSAGLDGCIHEHDLLTCSTKVSEPCHNGAIWCLAVNPATREIAAGTEDGCIVLFQVDDEGVRYSRSLDKQEGRILSLAWQNEEGLLVSGGIDNIRVWSLKSGHAIQRLTLGRQERNKETIVWAVAVTADMTIISGDSRGKTCFWNGRQGTCVKSVQSHKADVLCLAVNKSGTSVFSSGVDPTMTQFEYTASQPNSDWKMWVRSSIRAQHTHDVRALAVIGDSVVSGGVDCQLIFNHLESIKGIKTWRRISPVPHTSIPLVSVAKLSSIALFRYQSELEVWRLGSTNKNSDKNGDILQLNSQPIKLLQLKSKGEETIVCASISDQANFMAYSDQYSLRIFKFSVPSEPNMAPALKKFTDMPPETLPAHCMTFTPDGSSLITATNRGSVQMFSLDAEQNVATLDATLEPLSSTPGIHLLTVHPSGTHAAVGDHACNVHIYDLQKKQHICSVPQYKSQPTAIGFSPCNKNHNIIIAYSDQKILEYDYHEKEYTSWSRKLNKSWHPQWLKRHGKITQISYHPLQPHLILARDEQMFCIINKNQPFPSHSDGKMLDKSMWTNPESERKQTVEHGFHICSKYKYLLHLDVLSDGKLVIVERTPSAVLDNLPPALQVKKFGT